LISRNPGYQDECKQASHVPIFGRKFDVVKMLWNACRFERVSTAPPHRDFTRSWAGHLKVVWFFRGRTVSWVNLILPLLQAQQGQPKMGSVFPQNLQLAHASAFLIKESRSVPAPSRRTDTNFLPAAATT
jgi:hypothetical protein